MRSECDGSNLEATSGRSYEAAGMRSKCKAKPCRMYDVRCTMWDFHPRQLRRSDTEQVIYDVRFTI